MRRLRFLSSMLAVSATAMLFTGCSADTDAEPGDGPARPRLVALTFDDGPTPGYTDLVLDILREKKVTATFFVLGKNAAAHPASVKRIVAEGHVVGNHGYSHAAFDRLTPEQTFNEILGTQQIVHSITGHSPKFVRNPLGVETPAAQQAVRRLGLTGHVGWHWGGEAHRDDWACKGVGPTLQGAKDATRPGAVLLAHDANEVTRCPEQLEWLRTYIDWARAQGFEFGGLRTGPGPDPLNMSSWIEVVPTADVQRWNA